MYHYLKSFHRGKNEFILGLMDSLDDDVVQNLLFSLKRYFQFVFKLIRNFYMKKKNLVTVFINSYNNGETTIQKAIKSVVAQTYKTYELLFI